MNSTTSKTSTLRSAVDSWNRFWFRPTDPTALCLIRVLAGAAIVMIHFAYCFDLQELLGPQAWVNADLANDTRHHVPVTVPPTGWEYPTPADVTDAEQRLQIDEYVKQWGFHPIVVQGEGNFTWSIWFHLSDPATMRWVHGAILVVMFMFAIGFATRLTSALSLIAALQYVHRAQANLFGMDQMVIVLLLYLTIGNSGAVLSVDRWLVRRGFSWARLFGGQPKPVKESVEPSVSANLSLRLMQVHLCFIYAAAGMAKLLGSSWWSGTALWWAVCNYEFTWFRYSGYAAALRWLCSSRWLWEIFMTIGVAYTIVFQISFPYLVWQRRWRWLMVIGAVLLHTMISSLMGLLGFGLCMIALAMSFIPSEAVQAVLFPSARKNPQPVLQESTDDQAAIIHDATRAREPAHFHEPSTWA